MSRDFEVASDPVDSCIRPERKLCPSVTAAAHQCDMLSLAMKLTVFISCQNEISTVKKLVDTIRCSERFASSAEP
jgi:hypothetical protein